MEEKHQELLRIHRSKFIQCVDFERIAPVLQTSKVLTNEDIEYIYKSTSNAARVECLLDILPTKSSQSFQVLCLALENTYPHLLTDMFLDNPRINRTVPFNNCSVTDKDFSPINSSEYDLQQGNIAFVKAELKFVSHDWEILRRSFNKNSNKDSNFNRISSAPMNNRSFENAADTQNSFYKSNTGDKYLIMPPSNDFEELASANCDNVSNGILDLQLLRKQLAKGETVSKELDYYKKGIKENQSHLEENSSQKSLHLHTQYKELLVEKQQLEQEINHLQKLREEDTQELMGLKFQQQNGTNETVNQLYINALRKYEVLREDHETFKKRYNDLLSSHSALVANLEEEKKERILLKQQLEQMKDERNIALQERLGLQQQCTGAIRQWDHALRQRNELQEMLSKAQKQHEEAIKEVNQAMTIRLKAGKELRRLGEERDAAVREYRLVMSERDSVHREIERLQEELSEYSRKVQSLELQNKEITEELHLQIEALQCEINSALEDRDRALKELGKLKEKRGQEDRRADCQDWEICHSETDSGKDRDIIQQDCMDSLSRRESLREEYLDNLDQANQEIMKLRKQLSKLQMQLKDIQQEAEVSKRRREWALAERDKIVLERESIRTLCDRLRRERDRAISDLAEAIREADDLKRQYNEVSRELQDFNLKRENLELEKHITKSQVIIDHLKGEHFHSSPNQLKWKEISIQLNLTPFEKQHPGFELMEGPANDLRISSLSKSSPVKGLLQVNDNIIAINGQLCNGFDAQTVMRIIRNSKDPVQLLIRRQQHINSKLLKIKLFVGDNISHGLILESGFYVSGIQSGSAAALNGNVLIGDRIVEIQGCSLNGLEINQISQLLKKKSSHFTLTLMRYCLHFLNNEYDDNSHLTFDLQENFLSSQLQNNLSCNEKSRLRKPREIRKKVTSACIQMDESKDNHKCLHSGLKEILKGKLEFVRGRRHSKERIEEKNALHTSTSSNSEHEEQDAIAQLDHVIDSQRYTPDSGTVKCVWKKNNYYMKNGGTWPKHKGCDNCTLNQSKNVNERPTLKQIFPSYSKYEPELSSQLEPKKNKSKDDKSDKPFVLYNKRYSSKVQYQSVCDSLLSKENESESERLSSIYTPSDTSLDYSVKSGKIEKEVLEYYVKKKGNKLSQSDSESNMSPVEVHTPLFQPYCSMESNSKAYAHISYPVGYTRFGLQSYALPLFHPSHLRPTIHGTSPPYSSPPPFINKKRSDTTSFSPLLDTQPFYESYCINDSKSSELYYPVYNSGDMSSGSLSTREMSAPSFCSGSSTEFGRITHTAEYSISGFQKPEMENTLSHKKDFQQVRVLSSQNVVNQNSINITCATPMNQKLVAQSGGLPAVETDKLSQDCTSLSAWNKKLVIGEVRRIFIEKSSEPLGIQIKCLKSGGIFVSSVNADSLASRVGLEIGDQLLEVCGINMRNATYELAANVLRQCGGSITVLIQYNPDKFQEEDAINNFSSSSSIRSHSGSPTPCNSPRPGRTQFCIEDISDSTASTLRESLIGNKAMVTGSNKKCGQYKKSQEVKNHNEFEIHQIVLKSSSNIGITLTGGNAVGIFIHDVQQDSIGYTAGLRSGDQLLECNNIDLRMSTAEQAAYELAKMNESISLLIQRNPERYLEIQDQPGDGFYIRALTDSKNEWDSSFLKYKRGDILYVDNTMLNGVPGFWRAWLLDEKQQKIKCGIIPSKHKIEEEQFSHNFAEQDEVAKRNSASARRSFFRRKKHNRNSSRYSRELASFSDTGAYTDVTPSGLFETISFSYQRVEILDTKIPCPVIIFGPLANLIVKKLHKEFSHSFMLPNNDMVQCKTFPEFPKFTNAYKEDNISTIIQTISKVGEKKLHCLLDLESVPIQDLHNHHIYPIILFIKFKSSKQIRDIKDTSLQEKINVKEAKELFEQFIKLEAQFHHLISAIISAEYSLSYICNQINTTVEIEQNRVMWIPSNKGL